MMRLALALLALALGSVTVVATAGAETRYVTDQLTVTVRSAPADNHQRLATVRSDDAVEVLEQGPAYFRIRTAAGVVGWVPKQYLTPELPKSIRINQLQQQLEGRPQTGTPVPGSNMTQLQQELNQTKQRLTETIQRYNQLVQAGGSPPEVSDEVAQLRHRNQQLTAQLDILRQENESLIRTTGFYWLAAGGGVFLFGWLIGKISRRRRSSF